VPPNKLLERTVTRDRGDGASAPFRFALAPRFTRERAAAELRRYAARRRLLCIPQLWCAARVMRRWGSAIC
jgi:hypothetical protein